MSALNLDSVIQRVAETMPADIDGGLNIIALPTKWHRRKPLRLAA